MTRLLCSALFAVRGRRIPKLRRCEACRQPNKRQNVILTTCASYLADQSVLSLHIMPARGKLQESSRLHETFRDL